MRALIVIVAALCLTPLAAQAETGQSECEPDAENCTSYEIGEEEDVRGQRRSGGLVRTTGSGSRTSVSLLRARTDFIPELVKSVENI